MYYIICISIMVKFSIFAQKKQFGEYEHAHSDI